MTGHRFTRAERRWLATLADGYGRCDLDILPAEHAETFIEQGLVAIHNERYHLTVRGQIEAVRQHFQLLPVRAKPAPSAAGADTLAGRLLRLPAMLRRDAA